jgi:hypothetical protein
LLYRSHVLRATFMTPRRPLGFFLALATAAGCVPVVTPPARVDVGVAKRFEADRPFLRTSVGAHAASLVLAPDLPADVGAGYVAYTRSRGAGAGSEIVQGAYAGADARVAGGEQWRVFAGGRGEALFSDRAGEGMGYGAFGRASAEIMVPLAFQPVAGATNKGAYLGVAYGVFGVGAYLESGVQRLPGSEARGAFGAGLTVRVPATFGIFCCLWPKK